MRLVLAVVWIALVLLTLNRDAWDRMLWEVPQTERFEHAIQWNPEYSYLESWGRDLGKEQ